MKISFTLFFVFAFAFAFCPLFGQVGYTANDQVTPYTGKYRQGINMGWYPGWTNQSLADIAAGNPALGIPGIGARSNRLGLQEVVLDYFGYQLLVGDFQHWKSLGMDEFTAFLSGPTWPHQDKTQYCPGYPSSMFANMYTPIWDGGANGTPYNDENYFAAFVYKTVNQYKDEVRFWEVWNEPGFDLTGNLGWRDENYPGNWWLEGPNPCDNILRAPIYHYIRALRISWEIIKTVDPDSYVCLSGVGFLSFLNAILRNTDNPNAGDVSEDFPLLGGAYFDAIAIHSYPHFDASTLHPGINLFERHSDQAADGVAKVVNDYQNILNQYGYDGSTYPKKEWICTEINSPRQAYTGTFFAGHDAQINHMMKAAMVAKINRVHQLHSFQLFDQTTPQEANYEFHLMGMYQKIDGQPAYSQQVNDLGKAMKTMTDLIFDTDYDPAQTAALNLPPEARGYAWKRPDGTYLYALWARTTEDLSEAASATYSFPVALGATAWKRYGWDYGYSGATTIVDGQNIALDARPVFFTAEGTAPVCQLEVTVSNVTCDPRDTPNDPSDDTFSATVTVTGTNASGSWSGTVGNQPIDGALGAVVAAGPFAVSGGNVAISVKDAANPNCSASAAITAPGPCSGTELPVHCLVQSDFPWHDWIARVQLANLDHASGKSPYSDFSSLIAELPAGATVPLSLSAGFSWETFDEYWKIWIDYNRNGLFETPGELAYAGTQAQPANGTATAVHDGSLTVPANAAPGAARMRISMTRDAAAAPCGTHDFGEIEDYTVNITAGPGNRPQPAQDRNAVPETGALLLFPNPAGDRVSVDLQAFRGLEGRLLVYDARGQRVAELALDAATPALLTLPLSGYANGSYVVQIHAGGKTAVGRMTVARR